ncbi:hypothetical protein K8R47_03400 [archaeon]|nr:hypothetical protein [archaeon]
MKILFVTTGIAYGHCTRDWAIIQELKKKKHTVRVAGYSTSYDYFKDKIKTYELEPGLRLHEVGDKFSNILNILKNWSFIFNNFLNIIKLSNIVDEFKPDLIVSDWEPFVMFFRKTVFIWNYDPKLVKETDLTGQMKFQRFGLNLAYGLIKLFGKKIIIPSFFNKGKEENEIFISPIVRNKPSELDNETKLMKKLKLKKKPILVTIGGSNFGYDFIDRLTEVLNKFSDELFLVFDFKGKDTDNVKFLDFKENMLEYLKVSNGVITLGGHSLLSEALVFKKKALVFPIDDHIEQLSNAIEVGNFYEVDSLSVRKDRLEKLIRKFLKSKPNKINVKGEGVKEIVKLIENANDEIFEI